MFISLAYTKFKSNLGKKWFYHMLEWKKHHKIHNQFLGYYSFNTDTNRKVFVTLLFLFIVYMYLKYKSNIKDFKFNVKNFV